MTETFVPAGQEKKYEPANQAYVLSSGRAVRFEQPDLFAFAEGKLDIPNQVAVDIFHLIYRDRRTPDPAQQLLADQKHTQALYYAAQLVIVPRVKLDDDDDTGVIGRKELSLADLGAAYSFLLYGPPAPPAVPQPGSGQDTAAQSAPTE